MEFIFQQGKSQQKMQYNFLLFKDLEKNKTGKGNRECWENPFKKAGRGRPH